MRSKGDLVRAERSEIGILLEKGCSLRAIARTLGRDEYFEIHYSIYYCT
ncbi:helix-turn-helix domain-containing protein [Candidatus Kaiserbacteria bacterium]|nr:helix-turn-helix domain-containing protein [Candidatus Kaiserbacteria bacterium]